MRFIIFNVAAVNGGKAMNEMQGNDEDNSRIVAQMFAQEVQDARDRRFPSAEKLIQEVCA